MASIENSQALDLDEAFNMSGLELDLFIKTVYDLSMMIGTSLDNESYVKSLDKESILDTFNYLDRFVDFFLDQELLDYVEDILNIKLKLKKVLEIVQE